MAKEEHNPFREMGFIQFWFVSTLFCATFPASLVVCLVTMGEVKTKQLVGAIIRDFFRTVLFAIIGIAIAAGLVWKFLL